MFSWIRKMLGVCKHEWKFERMGAFSYSEKLLPIYKCECCKKLKVQP